MKNFMEDCLNNNINGYLGSFLNTIIENRWKLWLAFFIYTSLVALTIQLFIIPVFFPKWDAGGGLLISSLDSIGFQKLAVKMAQDIHVHGWGVWQLRPEGHAPAGIAALIYALTIPKLWVLIPMNAALHASATIVLLLIMQSFIKERRLAVLTVLPFFLFPSAALWYAQLHKEGFIILGEFLIIYGWINISMIENKNKFFLCLLKAMLYLRLGGILIWIMRPEILQIIQYVSNLVSLFLFVVFILRIKRKSLSKSKAITVIFFLMITPLFITAKIIIKIALFRSNNVTIQTQPAIPIQTQPAIPIQTQPAIPAQAQAITSADNVSSSDIFHDKWNNILFAIQKLNRRLSLSMNNQLKILVSKRKGFLTTPGCSNIDEKINFSSFKEAIFYIPRDLQIVFLAPFPRHWFGTGSFDSNTLMRRISGLEMIVVYISLCFLLYAIWLWRKQAEFWVIVLFSLPMMLFYGLVVCNIGSLYRLRYGFLMTFVALGIAGVIRIFNSLNKNHNSSFKAILIRFVKP